MGAAQSFRNFPLPVARAEEAADEEAEAPPPSPPAPKPSRNATLASLSEEELEELKQEIVNETVAKIAGDDGEKLTDLLEPSMETAPYDPRFPNRNQARHCFVRYNEYHKCVFERGEDHERCQFYQRAYQSMCPSDWLEQWGELRDKGLWTGKY
ncbi:hypothetical protein FOA52_007727 [Chlamydomonas sp. UWO 241]|nr:hypothetical protein FOA52_007727 [Chlamydomonas sp. UWO 241]